MKSPTTGRRYPLTMVCREWRVPRSSVYDERARRADGRPLKKRGPKPELSDAQLLKKIRRDLKDSAFKGEGHRKVWARLRRKGINVSRKRVQRLMRENQLLSPYRLPKGDGTSKEGHIRTDRPNVMWGTDGTTVWTQEDGLAWIFMTIDHFNDEVLGHHVTKKGDRFAALEPVRQGIRLRFGTIGAGVARGLLLRSDQGSQYMSADFQGEVRFLGITPSPTPPRSPESNGISERFIRTLRQEVIWGRSFRNVEELRVAVAEFIDRYNKEWLIERLGYRSPIEARVAFEKKAKGVA